MRDSTFHAVLKLRPDLDEAELAEDEVLELLEVDARPSDAIALAIRTGSGIWMLEEVVAEASIPVDAEADAEDQSAFSRFVDDLSPAALGAPSTQPGQRCALGGVKNRAFGRGRPVSLFSLGTMRALNSAAQMAAVLECGSGWRGSITWKPLRPMDLRNVFWARPFARTARQGSDHWVITSKLLPGLTFEEGQRRLDQILERLGLSDTSTTWRSMASTGRTTWTGPCWVMGPRLLEWALTSGRVTQVGFSSHGSNPLINRALRSQRFSFCSLHLHWLDPQRLPLARWALDQGLGVMAISPADKGGRLQAPSPTLVEDCSPFCTPRSWPTGSCWRRASAP